MSAHQAVFPIAAMARVLGVSKAGYYAWRRRPPSARAVADRVLMKRIRTSHVTSHETYGAPRIHAELRAAREKHGRKRIARLMRAAGIVGVSRRRGTVVTTRRDKDARPAPDLVDRDFSASPPNRRWVDSQAEARMAVFSFIEGWYNPARRHSGLGYLSPIAYEEMMQAEP